jgi:hypothetical protein
MRTYEQLTEVEQGQAIDFASESLYRAIVEGSVRFNDALNHDTLQAAIDAAGEEANRMQTPWFAIEYIRDATYTDDLAPGPQSVGDRLRGMARCDAEDALYPDPTERVIIRLPVANALGRKGA